MIKNYILSLLAMAYMPLMTIFTVLIFVSIFVLSNISAVIMKTVIGILAIVLAIVLFKYNIEKERIKKFIRQLNHAEEYDNCVMLGSLFLVEDRMIVYKKGQCKEYSYTDVTSVKLLHDKKKKAALTICGEEYAVPLASDKQGDKLASFLKRKNPSIQIDGFNEISLNQLHDIDTSL